MGKKIQRTTKHDKIRIVVAILAATVLGVFLWSVIQDKMDARHFANIIRDKDAVISEVIQTVPTNIKQVEQSNGCYRSEQGPYDSGKLWCNVASIVYLHEEADSMNLANQFIIAAQSRGFTTYVDTDKRTYLYSIGNKRWCEFEYVGVSDSSKIGQRTTLDNVQKPAFAITCADRAKAKHY